MKISKIETLHCDAGWRPWTFIKISTDEGIVGWSECTDSHGSPRGIEGVVKDLSPLIIGQDSRLVEKLYWEMYSRTRQSQGSIIQKAIGGIENALLDVKAKALGVPVYELFGGPLRDRILLYWSHCGTSRIRAWKLIGKKQLKSAEDIKKFGKEILDSGYKAIKTNIGVFGENPYVYMPGFFKSSGGPELNIDKETLLAIENWISLFRDTIHDKVDIALDLNFNFKTEGYIKIGRSLKKFKLLWLEIDSYNSDALLQIKQSISTPICSCENLYGMRGYRPYFEKHSTDIASIDVIWNGFLQSKKVSDLAELYEINVTPHNYNGHLSTFISAQFCAVIPNLRIMEYDVDDVPWRDDLFTVLPEIENGYLHIPKGPGWGTEVNEKVLSLHPWPR
jgi:L-alanine-DL-glutamate epimerase-like enolase superfamily enzyme